MAVPTLTTLARFNGPNGNQPMAGLFADAAGNLYGTTYSGGSYFDGTVFDLPVGSSTITTLATFNGANGSLPQAGLTADSNGNLYGTSAGGVNGFGYYGTVFEISGINHTFSTLLTFNSSNGANPVAGLRTDSAGNLYGTTSNGGANNDGTVFELTAGSRTLITPGTFNVSNGWNPKSSLLADSAGNLYGTAYRGGGGYGSVYRVSIANRTISTLASFNFSDGAYPQSDVITDSAGNLYGTTGIGGFPGNGTVFELTANGGLSTLASLSGTSGYQGPTAGLLADAAGNLYGTTNSLGPNNDGTVFEVTAGTHTLITLATFNGSSGNGEGPYGDLIADNAGNLYGTTSGNTIFKLSGTGFVTGIPEPAALSLLAVGCALKISYRQHRPVRNHDVG